MSLLRNAAAAAVGVVVRIWVPDRAVLLDRPMDRLGLRIADAVVGPPPLPVVVVVVALIVVVMIGRI